MMIGAEKREKAQAKRKRQKRAGKERKLAVASVSLCNVGRAERDDDGIWIADPGASRHLSGQRDLFEHMPSKKQIRVQVADRILPGATCSRPWCGRTARRFWLTTTYICIGTDEGDRAQKTAFCSVMRNEWTHLQCF